ncbi:copper amine oxidase N-terminal domain-containing protein [Bacillus ndiopicus]|uniref:copper amine oxidase N-terminal domain-containing protein n=1 Tax=Bacillus ndiopicus TaxID=1347368 RepID=UPI0006943324|nr:copper amine oxidase N-terminal domain-containing protein [Bacillus ndiopicus]
MKKAMTMALTATLATSAIAAPLAFAQDKAEPTSKEVKEEVATNFTKLTGKLGKIEKRDNGTLFTTIEQGDETFSLALEEGTLVLDNTGKKAELKEGLQFTAFVSKNKPMLMIYPPQYNPDVVVVETSDMGIAEVGTFDKDFVNKENTLKLNLSEESQITNLAGEQLKKEDIVGKEALVFYGPATFSIPAQTNPFSVIVLENKATDAEEVVPAEEVPNFEKFAGEITDIVARENGTQLLVIEDKEQPFSLTVDKETVILDNTGKKIELKKGMKFEAFVNMNKPVIYIYPPQYTPEAIIVQTEGAGIAEVGTYDADFLNHEITLKLNITDKTEITNLLGEKLTKDAIVDKQSLVFYTIATASIPSQTYPSKIIVLGEGAPVVAPEPAIQILDVLPGLIAQDSYEVNGVNMVPLRDLAEYFGFTVKSNGKGAIITKGDLSYEITRGQKEYTDNGVKKTFDEAPALLEKDKTYVQQDLIYILRNAQ